MSNGFSFSDLSITKKIHAITSISVVVFLVSAIINYSAMVDNKQALDELQTTSYKVVQLATSNKFLLEKLDDLYTQAVTFGDGELVDKADITKAEIFEHLKELKALDKSYQGGSEIQQLNEYAEISSKIAKGMIDGTADFSKIQDDAKNKSAKYDILLKSFKSIQNKADSRFIELVQSTQKRSDEALFLMLSISIVMLIGLIVLAIFIAKKIGVSAKSAANGLELLASGGGNLSSKLTVCSKDEIGQVAIHFNSFIGVLKGSVLEIMAVVEPLMENSTRLVQGMEKAETATTQQSSDAEIVRQSMEEMKQSVGDISGSAANAADAAQVAEKEVEQSLQQINVSMKMSQALSEEIQNASSTIDQLASDTQNVTQILNVITSIAEQTNLLALNAAIEAARAGEQGRGFAVVADEVRELASRTAKSTNEIRELLTVLTGAANESVGAMNSARDMARDNASSAQETGISIEKISEQILSINGMNAQIAAATEEQTSVAAMVVDNVSNMHNSFEDTQESLQTIREVAKNLHYLSDNLLDATSKFEV
ncbi:methyl-accepting chemotaxis protein [Pseudoalteromonas sp. C2R02]|uniref:methyl-accepting chemotaxis protein n=1 Tax=Pseudoalteromonas sp. C2R02 TaxID=2841565 RepID=UPI001C082CCD|nr:HAMP domain-containing methyl-accepting chemotaxis protein [Pseudoalteromonas sp. C2R02]MBU2971337.1 methyl-accepting chemotaxis protein [Pseudoalteromonas sp. C2R02]